LNTDLPAALRRRKPDKRRAQLKPRPISALLAASQIGGTGPITLVADTNVYIHNAAGTLPAAAEALLDRALLFHCGVCLGELAVGVANANPGQHSWSAIRDYYAKLFDSIPQNRILEPDAQTWIDAGLIAGTLARTQTFQPHQRKECLNDALILLTATRAGLAVLTSNRDEFDLIQQIAPEVRFVHY
jgi:predicted nucleic acid-binding protein